MDFQENYRNIYEQELDNLNVSYKILQNFYNEELSKKNQIIVNLSDVIDDMKLK